jgi:hypothetical protein
VTASLILVPAIARFFRPEGPPSPRSTTKLHVGYAAGFVRDNNPHLLPFGRDRAVNAYRPCRRLPLRSTRLRLCGARRNQSRPNDTRRTAFVDPAVACTRTTGSLSPDAV